MSRIFFVSIFLLSATNRKSFISLGIHYFFLIIRNLFSWKMNTFTTWPGRVDDDFLILILWEIIHNCLIWPFFPCRSASLMKKSDNEWAAFIHCSEQAVLCLRIIHIYLGCIYLPLLLLINSNAAEEKNMPEEQFYSRMGERRKLSDCLLIIMLISLFIPLQTIYPSLRIRYPIQSIGRLHNQILA